MQLLPLDDVPIRVVVVLVSMLERSLQNSARMPAHSTDVYDRYPKRIDVSARKIDIMLTSPRAHEWRCSLHEWVFIEGEQ
eukprot:scaffold11900_cov90-Cylindrotheca_fusiformis.AAC.3